MQNARLLQRGLRARSKAAILCERQGPRLQWTSQPTRGNPASPLAGKALSEATTSSSSESSLQFVSDNTFQSCLVVFLYPCALHMDGNARNREGVVAPMHVRAARGRSIQELADRHVARESLKSFEKSIPVHSSVPTQRSAPAPAEETPAGHAPV